MIYSRTARKDDLDLLNLPELLNEYVSIPKKDGDYNSSPYKFWDYAIVLRILSNELNNKGSVLNVSRTEDVVFNNICNNKGIKYSDITIDVIYNIPVRDNKFDVVCCLGSIEHYKKNWLGLIEKLNKHVKIGGYLVITTDEDTQNSKKRRIITIENLLEISLLLENMGYDFVSNSDHLIDYIYDTRTPSSLVMKRIGK